MVPGKPVAYNYGLVSVNYWLLYGIVAYFFRLLGVPGCYAWYFVSIIFVLRLTGA